MRLTNFLIIGVFFILISSCEPVDEQAPPENSEDRNTPYGAGEININIAITDSDILTEGAYHIPKEDAAMILSFTNHRMVMNSKYNFFSPGNIINSGPTEHAPYGILKKIKSIIDYGTFVIYELEDVALNEYFKELNIHEQSIDLTSDYDKQLRTSGTEITLYYSGVIKDFDGNENTKDDRLLLNGNVTLANPLIDLDFDISEGNINNLSYGIKGKIGAVLGLDLPGVSSSTAFSSNNKFLDKNISKIVIAITGVAGRVATLVLVPKFVIEFNLDGIIKSDLEPEIRGDMDFDFFGQYQDATGFSSNISTSNEDISLSYVSGTNIVSEVSIEAKLLAGLKIAIFNQDDNSFTLGTSVNLETAYVANNNPALNSNLVIQSVKELKIQVPVGSKLTLKHESDWNEELYRKDDILSLGYRYLERSSGHFQFWDGIYLLTDPIVAKVVNENNDPVPDIDVLFDSNGGFNGVVMSKVKTNSEGLASTTWLPNNIDDTIKCAIDLNQSAELELKNQRSFYLSPTAESFPLCMFQSNNSVNYEWASPYSVSSDATFQKDLQGEIFGDSIRMNYWYTAGLATRRVELKYRISGDTFTGILMDCKASNDGSRCIETPTESIAEMEKFSCY